VAIYEFDGYRPVVHESAFVHPLAAVTGNVVIGRDVYVGPGAAIRADWGEILIADGCNVQECCVIHVFPGATVTLDESAHIGHGAVIHGANIGRNTLVGMSSVVMDRARIGAECVIGAMSFVRADMVVADRKVVVGNPARVVKDALTWAQSGTADPAQCAALADLAAKLRFVRSPPYYARASWRYDHLAWSSKTDALYSAKKLSDLESVLREAQKLASAQQSAQPAGQRTRQTSGKRK